MARDCDGWPDNGRKMPGNEFVMSWIMPIRGSGMGSAYAVKRYVSWDRKPAAAGDQAQ